MNTPHDVENLIRQTQRYEFSDGLRDLQFALLLSTLGIMNWVALDKADVWLPFVLDLRARFGVVGRWSALLIMLLPSLLAVIALLLIRLVRRQWLWRESGYVNPRRWLIPRRVNLISFAILLVALIGGVLLQRTTADDSLFLLRVLMVGSGWSFGYVLVAMGRLLDIRRYVPVGIVGSVVTTVLLLLPLSAGQTSLYWGLTWGILLILSAYRPLLQAARLAHEAQHER